MKDGWKEVTLGEVCEEISKVQRTKMAKNDTFIYLDIGGIDNKTNKIINHKEFKWKDAPSRAQQIVKKGDVLFSTVRTYLKNIAQVDKAEYNNQICSSGFTVIRGLQNIIFQDYLFYLSLFEGFLQPLNDLQTGSSYPAVRNKDVFNQKIPLPPLPEQQKVVAKIESLFSELDNGIANLKAAQAKLTIYRQSVLKKAFEGELTKAWRDRQTDLPDAETLLAQIKAERIRHYEMEMTAWKEAVKVWEKEGKVGWKPKKPGKLTEFEDLTTKEFNDLPKIPKKWNWVKNTYTALKITDGEHITPKRETQGYYLLSARNIQNGFIDLSNVDFVGEDEYIRIRKRCNPDFGDILISCSGSIGRIAYVPKDLDFVMVRSVALVKTNKNIYNYKFLEYLFQSPILQSQIEKGKKATAQANLFLGPIGNLRIINCTLSEQTQIVQEIESRLSAADEMLASIEGSLEKAEALRQSILKQAFEGKLV